MIRKWMITGAGPILVALMVCASGPFVWAAPQEKPAYTMAEYNAYNAAAVERNPQQRAKLLDDFVAKFPNSTLLPFAYRVYYKTYDELKNYPKTIEYADKLLALGDKLDAGTKLEALYIRTLAFNNSFNEKAPEAKEQATSARKTALEGLQVLGQVPKPEGVTDAQFEENKKVPTVLFNYTAGYAALQLKDYKGAIDSFKAALALDPTGAVTYFRMGVAYLQMDPPQYMDGFWALARSVALKGPGEAQVRAYLRNQLLRYQLTACEKLLDAQMNELITLAEGSAERPATYKIPSAADLQKAREETTNFISDLKAGGEKAKLVWLATCGLEFPEVAGKVIAVDPTDPIVLRVYNGTTQEEIEAATTPNMEVKIEGQPDAKRIQKDDPVQFSATLVGYDPDPFMLHWDKAKVNPEFIPEDKPHPGSKRPVRRPPAKKPGL